MATVVVELCEEEGNPTEALLFALHQALGKSPMIFISIRKGSGAMADQIAVVIGDGLKPDFIHKTGEKEQPRNRISEYKTPEPDRFPGSGSLTVS